MESQQELLNSISRVAANSQLSERERTKRLNDLVSKLNNAALSEQRPIRTPPPANRVSPTRYSSTVGFVSRASPTRGMSPTRRPISRSKSPSRRVTTAKSRSKSPPRRVRPFSKSRSVSRSVSRSPSPRRVISRSPTGRLVSRSVSRSPTRRVFTKSRSVSRSPRRIKPMSVRRTPSPSRARPVSRQSPSRSRPSQRRSPSPKSNVVAYRTSDGWVVTGLSGSQSTDKYTVKGKTVHGRHLSNAEYENLSRKTLVTQSRTPAVSARPHLEVVNYSNDRMAIFGETRHVKDQLRDLGATHHTDLMRYGQKVSGWTIPKSRTYAIESIRSLQ